MVKSREIRNIITVKDSIGYEYIKFPSGKYKHYLFLCKHEGCNKKLKIRKDHIQCSTGRCKKHANMMKPFEANFGSIKRGARHRNLEFKLTYEDYIEYTKINNCFYCGKPINWIAYNEHGKNNPGYFLDRMDNNEGYTVENCVVCCTRCNFMKHTMSYSEFWWQIKNIAINLNIFKKGSCG